MIHNLGVNAMKGNPTKAKSFSAYKGNVVSEGGGWSGKSNASANKAKPKSSPIKKTSMAKKAGRGK